MKEERKKKKKRKNYDDGNCVRNKICFWRKNSSAQNTELYSTQI